LDPRDSYSVKLKVVLADHHRCIVVVSQTYSNSKYCNQVFAVGMGSCGKRQEANLQEVGAPTLQTVGGSHGRTRQFNSNFEAHQYSDQVIKNIYIHYLSVSF